MLALSRKLAKTFGGLAERRILREIILRSIFYIAAYKSSIDQILHSIVYSDPVKCCIGYFRPQ